jgi:inhibitor of Bruton tyrosine kinase
LNLSRLLESNVLDSLDMEILQELSVFYRKYFSFETDSSHVITPAFDAPTDEEIEKAIEGFDLTSYTELMQQTMKKTPKNKNKLSKSEQLKRNYEKEGMKKLRDEEVIVEPTTPKSPEINNNVAVEVDDSSWQKKRERKDSGKRKSVTASKCNEIMKTEEKQVGTMVDLKSLNSPDSSRNLFTLADFVTPKKKTDKEVPIKVEIAPKPAWNMSNVELKPAQNGQDPFKITNSKKKVSLPSPKPSSAEKNFSSIIRDERKDKSNYEKIMSKSLILTQIEEKAIQELSEFYNIDNIFDENISISRKVHKTSQNLSQWQHSNGA